MKIKVSELSIPQLNYAVALCEGEVKEFLARSKVYPSLTGGAANDLSIGVPIIEREKISLLFRNSGRIEAYKDFSYDGQDICYSSFFSGKTPLIAAMCCYVASKLGLVVEIPDELISSSY